RARARARARARSDPDRRAADASARNREFRLAGNRKKLIDESKPTLEDIDAEITSMQDQVALLQREREKMIAMQEAEARARAEAERKATEEELAKVLGTLHATEKLAEELRKKLEG
ncbi:MAG: hypothetical protein ACOC1F_10010, partial [Myxococcota bacterium]